MLFIFRFWPVLIPALIYFIWREIVYKKSGVKPHFRAGHMYWLVIATLLVAFACFMVLGFSNEENKGTYEPSHLENGSVVPPQVRH